MLIGPSNIDNMASDPRRQLPAVDQWLASVQGTALCAEYSRAEVVTVMRDHLARHRDALQRGAGELPDLASAEYAARLRADLLDRRRPTLQRAINATGIVVHTNLGRAPLAPEALAAIEDAARGYSTLELDLTTGERGSRYGHVESLLTQLTGTEAAVVVNNCAAAVLLALNTCARDGEVVVSRGELIEIGGSLRMPDLIAQSGARLVEVGTTNRTSLQDYALAITENTRVLLASHPSNYRIVGFTAKPSLAELAQLARERGLICVQDLGSGSLIEIAIGDAAPEPTVAASLRCGVDLVLFSGDKMLGGPQAGIVAGRADLIDRIKHNPLTRALRIDKLSLAALAATLRLYLPPNEPRERVPVLRMIAEPKATIARRATALRKRLRADAGIEAELADDVSYAGGGALPLETIPTKVVRVRAAGFAAAELARRLRVGEPAVIGRIADGALVLDPRTVAPQEIPELAAAVHRAIR
jgi:L-seryl-tRNA(Ser) seleniumtransferase